MSLTKCFMYFLYMLSTLVYYGLDCCNHGRFKNVHSAEEHDIAMKDETKKVLASLKRFNETVAGVASSNAANEDTLVDEYDQLCTLFDSQISLETVVPTYTLQGLRTIFNKEFERKENRFCYLRCIHHEDREIFIVGLLEHIICSKGYNTLAKKLARIVSGGILLEDWMVVMRSITSNLQHTYVLYRSAYWGENSRRFSNSRIPADYVCKVEVFGSEERIHRIHILFNGSHLSVLSNVKLSAHVNLERMVNGNVAVYTSAKRQLFGS
jgi:hypothetical protein